MKRNNFIDLLRFVFSIFIIAIHILTINYFKALLRIAVPCFFIISGYFIVGKNEDKIKKTIIHILKLVIISNILYFLWNGFLSYRAR